MLLSTEFQTSKKYCADLQGKQSFCHRSARKISAVKYSSGRVFAASRAQMPARFYDGAKILTVVGKFFLSDRMKERTFPRCCQGLNVVQKRADKQN